MHRVQIMPLLWHIWKWWSVAFLWRLWPWLSHVLPGPTPQKPSWRYVCMYVWYILVYELLCMHNVKVTGHVACASNMFHEESNTPVCYLLHAATNPWRLVINYNAHKIHDWMLSYFLWWWLIKMRMKISSLNKMSWLQICRNWEEEKINNDGIYTSYWLTKGIENMTKLIWRNGVWETTNTVHTHVEGEGLVWLGLQCSHIYSVLTWEQYKNGRSFSHTRSILLGMSCCISWIDSSRRIGHKQLANSCNTCIS